MIVNILQSFCAICFILVFSKCFAKDLKILKEFCSDNGGCKTESDAWSCQYKMDPKTNTEQRECRTDKDFLNGVGGLSRYVNALDVIELSYFEKGERSCSLRAQVNLTIPASELQDVTNATFQFRYEEYVGAGALECSTIHVTRVKPTNDDLTLLLECTQNISERELNIDVIGRTQGKAKDAYWLDRDAKRDFSFSPVITASGDAEQKCCIEYESGLCTANPHWPDFKTIIMISVVSLAGVMVLITIIVLAKTCSKSSQNKPDFNPAADTTLTSGVIRRTDSGTIITALLPQHEPIPESIVRGFLEGPLRSDDLSVFTASHADDNDSNFDSVSVTGALIRS